MNQKTHAETLKVISALTVKEDETTVFCNVLGHDKHKPMLQLAHDMWW